MTRNSWHILREDRAVTVTRVLPVRFDLRETTCLPAGAVSLTRLAQQVRQDVWRALRRMGGFAPAVRVSHEMDTILVEAGGRTERRAPARAGEDLRAVLEDPDNRRRWLAHAGRRAQALVIVAAMGVPCTAATTVRGQEETPAVPSGLPMTLQEAREEVQLDGTLWLRLRYVAPDLATGGYAAVAGDFAALCAAQALGYPTTDGRKPAQAVISISSAPVEFATTAPGVMQVFEAFRLENDTCVWEEF
jgi:hypothetical protein